MGGAADAVRREMAVGNGLPGGFGALNHRKHDALGAEIEGFLGPGGGGFREAEDGGGTGGGEGVEAGEGGGDAAVAVLHVDDGEVVAGESGDLGDGGGEAEEEDAVEGFTSGEAGFESVGAGGVGGKGEIGR